MVARFVSTEPNLHGIAKPVGLRLQNLPSAVGTDAETLTLAGGLVANAVVVLAAFMLNRLKARWRSAGWNEFVLLLTLVAVCAGVWIFVELAGAVSGNTHLETETKIMRAFRNPADLSQPVGPWWLGELARDITSLGSALMVITMTLLVSGFLLLRKQYGRVLLIVLTIAGGYALNKTLKHAFDRARPDIVPHLAEVSTSSFPSGHSMASSVVYITLAALLAQSTQSRREKIYIILAAFFLTFVIGLSRVLLGVHYPTDVLAGWSAGTAWALVCWLIANTFFKRPPAAPVSAPDA